MDNHQHLSIHRFCYPAATSRPGLNRRQGVNQKHHNRPVDRPAYAVPGAISANEIYRSDEAKARAGWRDSAFRAACRRGLKVHRCGKRTYVTGAALVAFITKQPEGGAA